MLDEARSVPAPLIVDDAGLNVFPDPTGVQHDEIAGMADTVQGAALNQGAWQRLEARENELATGAGIAIYVLTGLLFERVLPPLPRSDERHRLPSGYWEVVVTQDGRLAAFIMDTAAPRTFYHFDARVTLDEVELRSRLGFFCD